LFSPGHYSTALKQVSFLYGCGVASVFFQSSLPLVHWQPEDLNYGSEW